ncbi:MAG: RNA polymerase sigma factor, partial [Pedobacter sp.]
QPEIIERLQSGDGLAFSEIVNRWKDMVFNTVLGIVQNAEDAEDITQEVFVQVYESISKFRQEAKLSTWIYRIAISKALDFEKKKKRLKHGGLLKRIFDSNAADEVVHFDHPGILLDKKQHAAALFAAVKKLPKKQRVAFLLHKLETLSYHEIAEIMNTSVMAVESLQVRARNSLRKILAEYYKNEIQ